MYFRDIYKPIPNIYNLVLAMLWRHPENVELHKVKVVHYCAAVSIYLHAMTTLLVVWYMVTGFSLIRLICRTMTGFKAVEVHRERREHAERRHKDACQEVVGYLRR